MSPTELERNLAVLDLPHLPPETLDVIRKRFSGKEDIVSLGF
jgi:hypothetical protein